MFVARNVTRGRLSSSLPAAVLLCCAASLPAQAQQEAPAGAAAPAAPEAGAAPAPPPPLASDPATAEALADVDQRARIVERRLELLEEAAAAQKAAAPIVSAGERGFSFKSADSTFIVKVRGLIHADGRFFVEDKDLALRDTFLVRRARPLLEATFFDLADFRLMPDFGNGQAVVQDAYVDLRPVPWLKLRGGKFKPPIGLERLQSASAIVFPERGFPTGIAPNRDVGFQLHGLLGPGVLTYEAGVFNGVPDGSTGTNDQDNNKAKDFEGRLFVQPLKWDPYSVLAGLGVGFAGGTGNQRGTPAVFQTTGTTTRRTANSNPWLPVYRSPGQQTIFSYLVNDEVPNATVIAKGRRTRLAPQAYYYLGGFGLLGEYIQSKQRVEKGDAFAVLTNRSWQVAASFVFGGKNLYEGVTVTTPFDPKTGALGALEVGARYNEFRFDEDSFPTFANPASSVERARAFGGVVNWHWSKNIKLSLSYERTDYKGGAPMAGDRKPENALFQRIQAAF